LSSGAPTGGRLVLVATPIGNLGDLSPRARDVLATADVICCEDTRRTRALLSATGLSRGDRLVSLHGHNEADRVEQVASLVAAGATVAVVSDAGTPGISDPGGKLVAELSARGETVSTVPGPSSVVGALVVSGLPTDRFCVEGFLPRKGGERRRRVAALMADERTTIVLEAPGRVAATLDELAAVDSERPAAVVRELTKLHEEVWRGTLAAAAAEFASREVRGEVVLVVGGAPERDEPDDGEIEAAARAAIAHEPGAGVRHVADRVAGALGVPRRRAYEATLRVRDGAGGGRSVGSGGDGAGGDGAGGDGAGGDADSRSGAP
jgi:16S rRNA (cytidine1402-2'-O)-methyltransferase